MNAATKTLDQQFADFFTNLAAGLDHLPEDMAAAVRQLPPEETLPPPWFSWLYILLLQCSSWYAKALEVLRTVFPKTIPRPEGFPEDYEKTQRSFPEPQPWGRRPAGLNEAVQLEDGNTHALGTARKATLLLPGGPDCRPTRSGLRRNRNRGRDGRCSRPTAPAPAPTSA